MIFFQLDFTVGGATQHKVRQPTNLLSLLLIKCFFFRFMISSMPVYMEACFHHGIKNIKKKNYFTNLFFFFAILYPNCEYISCNSE